MDAELQPRVNFPAVLINRHDLCVVIAVLSMSILGCAGVLGYSFTNYGKLKRNAVDMRHYLGSHAQMARQRSGDSGWVPGEDARSNATKAPEPELPAAGHEPGRDAAPPNRTSVVARQEALNGTVVPTLHTNVVHGDSSEEPTAATDATSKSAATTVNTTLETTSSSNATEDAFTKVA